MADWFKFYNDGLDSKGMQFAMAEQPLVTSVWLVIMSEASKNRSNKIKWADEDFELIGFARRINVTVPQFNQSITLLERIKYITREGGFIVVHGWDKLQSDYARGVDRGYYKKTSDTLASNSLVSTARREEKRVEEKYKTNRGFALKESGVQLLSLIETCKELLGEEEMTKYHKRWTERAMSDPVRLEKVLSDMKDFKLQNGVIKKSAGAMAEQLWGLSK